MPKQPKALVIFLLFALLALGGCAASEVRCSEIKDIAAPCLRRHDAYIQLDDSDLGAKERPRRQALSQQAKALLEQETAQGEELGRALGPCLDVHDAYVEADKSLTASERRTFLRSSRITREVVAEAGGGR